MKKTIFLGLALALVLTGCNSKSDGQKTNINLEKNIRAEEGTGGFQVIEEKVEIDTKNTEVETDSGSTNVQTDDTSVQTDDTGVDIKTDGASVNIDSETGEIEINLDSLEL